MMERRRGPGRPAYDSKQKLVAAACSLLAERGFEATSPQMFQQRSGVGHGSMYHHFPGKGKEGLALDAISHMRASTLAFLDGSPTPNPDLHTFSDLRGRACGLRRRGSWARLGVVGRPE